MFGVQQDCSSSSVKCPEEFGSMERKPRGSSETSEKLSDFEFEQVFQPECTVILDRSMDRLAVSKTLVEKLAQQEQIDSQHARCIVRNLVDQDRRCSSVTQEGFAFPHLVTPVISKPVGAIGFAPKGISMTTSSSCSVRLVVLTVSPFPRPGVASDWHPQLQRWLM